jgi:hypothetical protein
MSCLQILAVRVEQREEAAVNVQKILTEYGCSIRTRLGLHDQASDNTCSPSGILLLQLCCDKKTSQELEKKLAAVAGVKAKLIDLAD